VALGGFDPPQWNSEDTKTQRGRAATNTQDLKNRRDAIAAEISKRSHFSALQ
jgi:hypothetical protein